MTEHSFRWTHIRKREELEPFYLSVLDKIRAAAKECGYAVGVHGSLGRDFDLIAVPWIEQHSSKDDLAHAIHRAACGLERQEYQWEKKPAGRWATSLPICWIDFDHAYNGMGHIDLSVIEN